VIDDGTIPRLGENISLDVTDPDRRWVFNNGWDSMYDCRYFTQTAALALQGPHPETAARSPPTRKKTYAKLEVFSRDARTNCRRFAVIFRAPLYR